MPNFVVEFLAKYHSTIHRVIVSKHDQNRQRGKTPQYGILQSEGTLTKKGVGGSRATVRNHNEEVTACLYCAR